MGDGRGLITLQAGTAGGLLGLLLAVSGFAAFNLGYLDLYQAFVPLLCIGVLLRVEVGQDWFLSLLLFAVTSPCCTRLGCLPYPYSSDRYSSVSLSSLW